MTSRLLVAAVATVVLGLAGLGLWQAAQPAPSTLQDDVHTIAATLRCPTCQGLSVADSDAPISQSMRDIIAEQLAEGRTAEEVRGYFVQRYGDWILLSPRSSGLGWLVWALPVLSMAGGVGVALAHMTRSPRPTPRPSTSTASDGIGRRVAWASGTVAFVAVIGGLLFLNLAPRGVGGLPTGTLPSVASPPATPDGGLQAGTAVDRDPGNVPAQLELAARLLRSGDPSGARRTALSVLDQHPDQPDGLLLLGLALAAEGSPVAPQTLQRFLDNAPADHPGIPLARSFLDQH